MRSSCVLTLLAALSASTPALAADVVPGQFLLHFVDAAAHEDLDREWKSRVTQLAADLEVELAPQRRLPMGWLLVVGPASADPLAFAQTLAEHPEVEAASPNWRYRPQLTPDDDDFDAQWALQSIRAEGAWELGVGDAAARVGIVDSGVRRDHRDLQNRLSGGYDFVRDPDSAGDGDGVDPDFADAFDRAECGGQTVDGDYHGTHVAGVLAATTDNNRGVAGVDWRASVFIARATGVCGQTALSDVMDAVGWLAGAGPSDVPAL